MGGINLDAGLLVIPGFFKQWLFSMDSQNYVPFQAIFTKKNCSKKSFSLSLNLAKLFASSVVARPTHPIPLTNIISLNGLFESMISPLLEKCPPKKVPS